MADDEKKDEAEVEQKPKRRLRRSKAEVAEPKAEAADEPKAADEPTADEPTADEPTADEPKAADEPTAEAADEQPEQKPAAKTKAKSKAKNEPKVAEAPKKVIPVYDPENPPVIRAHARYVRTSARKARLVCDHIRGHSVPEARLILAHTPRAVAEDWQKLLESAVANAEHNLELDGDTLRILTVQADEGPTLKRFRPRAMGRASAIHKRTSHLSISLTPKE